MDDVWELSKRLEQNGFKTFWDLIDAYEKVKEERDAAVKELEELMRSVNSQECCIRCKKDRNGCHSNFSTCRPKWRGLPGGEEDWK